MGYTVMGCVSTLPPWSSIGPSVSPGLFRHNTSESAGKDAAWDARICFCCFVCCRSLAFCAPLVSTRPWGVVLDSCFLTEVERWVRRPRRAGEGASTSKGFGNESIGASGREKEVLAKTRPRHCSSKYRVTRRRRGSGEITGGAIGATGLWLGEKQAD
jgi:hypothetical protein